MKIEHTHTHTLASPYAEKTRKRWSGQTSAQEELMTDENFTNTTVRLPRTLNRSPNETFTLTLIHAHNHTLTHALTHTHTHTLPTHRKQPIPGGTGCSVSGTGRRTCRGKD